MRNRREIVRMGNLWGFYNINYYNIFSIVYSTFILLIIIHMRNTIFYISEKSTITNFIN